LPLCADALRAASMSIGHKYGVGCAIYGQGKERKLWQK